MIAADLLAILNWSPASAPIQIYTPNGTTLAAVERAYLTARGVVVLVTKEKQCSTQQLSLF